ncbi:hypothetical protein Pan216_53320 [Planctomycetes bacterium Pan216]|uniref:Circularly permuted ATP-grasp type 2 domain-containing protein n=1 Tax=Kolteria novifilia TaxID=2527975 RepID=A0A518BBU4_9BACT|nr:hypothetical protein Pan216_53320 [Planctomycetes bacterium Pan216]
MSFGTYPTESIYDEIFDTSGQPREICTSFVRRLESIPDGELEQRQRAADLIMRDMGITFAVYGHEAGTEKVWPCDLVPRIIDGEEWAQVEQGLKQRITALNLFIDDIYNDQKIIKDGIIPEQLIRSSSTFQKACVGFRPPAGVWCHISGIDLVRNHDGRIYVLEDNLRCPSGVSYVLENREVMKRTFPHVFEGMAVAPIEGYPERLLEALLSCAPPHAPEPTAVVLSPGIYNSAYFEHTFLAQQMGVELVQPTDLIVSDGYVHMRTTRGLKRVDVIYRRIDDEFLDPACFRSDSCLGVEDLMQVYFEGRVTLANAPGTGVADDKAVYAFVPEIISYYLGEDPILNNVPTYVCSNDKERDYVIGHLDELVVKPTNESGGYGILMGPQSTKAERDRYAEEIRANPRNYIAQPMLKLSTVPTLIGGKLQPRHVDLRPFVLCGEDVFVLPGGLTRVALREGSMVVNSSQGGGSKDTWVLRKTNGKHDPASAIPSSQSQEQGSPSC